MTPESLDVWYRKTKQLEGSTAWMYLDVKGLVTCAIGLLIDPVEMAFPLQWTIGGHANIPAAAHEVSIAWHKVKNAGSMKLLGGGHPRWGELTDLRLTEDGIRDATLLKYAQNDMWLRKRFAQFGDWPEQAQIFCHSMAWACGPAFHFPKLAAALQAQDWEGAAKECHIDDAHNPGVRPRNRWNEQLLLEAANPPPSTDPDVTSETFPNAGVTELPPEPEKES